MTITSIFITFYYKCHTEIPMEIQILNLLSPLYYVETDSDPFNYMEGDGERLYCFLINKSESSGFEPDKKALIDRLVFSASAITGAQGETVKSQALPEGSYLFAQKREILSREEIIDMAVEIQAEGLWRRLKPGNTLYLRYLFEDSKSVTQLYRPYT
jgi:hypothetical protein